jgi:ArsR family transcriptional regulator
MIHITNIFKLLSDDTRLRIILLLFQKDLCVCEISGILNVPQPSVSKSLSKLRDLNLVTDDRREKFVFYSLKKENSFLTNTLQLIINQIDEYPQILEDSNRLENKDAFLNQCCPVFEQ